MFFTKTKIGFTKIQEKSVSSNFCNSVSLFTAHFKQGSSKINNLVVESTHPGVIYASTERGEIHIYEASNKGESMECKPRGRI